MSCDRDVPCSSARGSQVRHRVEPPNSRPEADRTTKHASVRLAPPVTSAAQQAVAADGRASLLLEKSILSPVVEYHGLGRCHLQRLAFLDAAAAEQRYVGRAWRRTPLSTSISPS